MTTQQYLCANTSCQQHGSLVEDDDPSTPFAPTCTHCGCLAGEKLKPEPDDA
ncbi:hypothetical protein [Cellulosimicrobium sp. Marseille-Q8652]